MNGPCTWAKERISAKNSKRTLEFTFPHFDESLVYDPVVGRDIWSNDQMGYLQIGQDWST